MPRFGPFRITPLALAIVTLAGLSSATASAATLTVTNTADDMPGTCTLRAAITAMNAGADSTDCVSTGQPWGSGDTIAFAIPTNSDPGCDMGSGVCTISVSSVLPYLNRTMAIDGYTQPGAAANTLAAGTNADIRIALVNGGAVNYGLIVTGGNGSSVRGLRITGFTSSGLWLSNLGSVSNVTVAGNFIGTDGFSDLGNSNGIRVNAGVVNATIGGPAPADRNLIAGNDAANIQLQADAAAVKNNLIGTAANGTTPLFTGTNPAISILSGASGNTLAGNVIGGPIGIQIQGAGADGNIIVGNAIGVGADGIADIGGDGHGIWIYSSVNGTPLDTLIGGLDPGDGNVIANWGGDGIHVNRADNQPFSTGNLIYRNAIYNNGFLGIDLRDDIGSTGTGPNPNDPNDPDDGPNHYQNHPVASTAATNGATTSVTMTLTGTPNTPYRVEFFTNPGCDASGYGEGQTWLGTVPAITDGTGNTTGFVNALPATTVGHFLTMTATNLFTNDTSEFSPCQLITAAAQTPPVMGDVPDQTASLGVPFSLDLSGYVTMTDGDPVTSYALSGPLPGLSLNTATGVLSGTPNLAGGYSVTVTASDNDGASNADTILITVIPAAGNGAANATPIPDLSGFGLAWLSTFLALTGGLARQRARRGANR